MRAAIPIALGVALLAVIGLAQGCALDEILTVDVQKQTRDHYAESLNLDVPPEVTLRQARQLREQSDDRFRNRMENLAEQHRLANQLLDTEIGDAALAEQLIGSGINQGIELGVPMLENVPAGGILASMLVGLGAWFAPRPGDAKRRKEAEDKGYDMGRNETLDSLTRSEK